MGSRLHWQINSGKKKMISAIITCAGNHSRFGRNKLLSDLAGKPVFIRTLEQFQKAKKIDEIIVSIRQEDFAVYKKILNQEKIKAKLVIGGEERYVSSYNGVKVSQGDYVVIHDGARPLVPSWLIDKVAEKVAKHQAIISAVRPFTCIKKGKGFLVEECLARSETWVAQTPQAFVKKIITKAYQKAIKDKEFNGMDDCELVSSLGFKVKVVNGDINNIKITVPTDLIIVEKLYQQLKGVL